MYETFLETTSEKYSEEEISEFEKKHSIKLSDNLRNHLINDSKIVTFYSKTPVYIICDKCKTTEFLLKITFKYDLDNFYSLDFDYKSFLKEDDPDIYLNKLIKLEEKCCQHTYVEPLYSDMSYYITLNEEIYKYDCCWVNIEKQTDNKFIPRVY